MRSGAFKIAVTYTVVGLLWIALSDRALFLFDGTLSRSVILFLGSIKGTVYVLLTGYMVYQLINRWVGRLETSEKQYRSYFEDNPTPMWIFSKTSLHFLVVNDAAIAKYGYSREEFLSMTIMDIRPESEKARLKTSVPSNNNVHKNLGIWTHVKKDGTQIQVNITSHVMVSEGAEKIMVMARDETERIGFANQLQQANLDLISLNQELGEQKRLLSEAQHISRLGGWEYDLQNDQLKRSEAIFEILDFASPDEEHPVENLIQHIHQDDKALFLDKKNDLEQRSIPMDSTFRVFNDHGGIQFIRQIAHIESQNGRPYRINGSMQDITEIKQLEAERNKYLRKLENTLESISDAFFTIDRNWTITSVNSMFQSVSGLSKEKVLNKNFIKVWPHTQGSVIFENFEKTLQERVTVKFEEYSGGLKKWLRMIAYPTNEGAAIYFADITESKLKDIQLKEALERYDLAARATRDMFYEYDLINNKILFSKNYNNSTAIDVADSSDPAQAWLSLIHPDDLPLVINANTTALTSGENKYECKYRVKTGDGEYRYMHDQAYVIFDENNLPSRMIGAVRDIHDLKLINDENKRLAEIINKINNMVLITDTKRQVIWANKAFEIFANHRLSDIKGGPLTFLKERTLDPRLLGQVIERADKQESFAIEMPAVTFDNKMCWIFAEYTPLYDNNGVHNGYITIYTDITALKEKEASLLKQNEILREISWLGSHDVRRPLASIMGLINLIKLSEDDEEKAVCLDFIDISAQELDAMVHKINHRISEVTV